MGRKTSYSRSYLLPNEFKIYAQNNSEAVGAPVSGEGGGQLQALTRAGPTPAGPRGLQEGGQAAFPAPSAEAMSPGVGSAWGHLDTLRPELSWSLATGGACPSGRVPWSVQSSPRVQAGHLTTSLPLRHTLCSHSAPHREGRPRTAARRGGHTPSGQSAGSARGSAALSLGQTTSELTCPPATGRPGAFVPGHRHTLNRLIQGHVCLLSRRCAPAAFFSSHRRRAQGPEIRRVDRQTDRQPRPRPRPVPHLQPG